MRAGATPEHWVLVELHPALQAVSGGEVGPLLLDEARAIARDRLGSGSGLALVGPGDVEKLAHDRLDALGPGDLVAREGDLARAALRVVEAGARRLTVVSPLRDASGELARVLSSLPVPVEVVRVGGPLLNAALVDIEWAPGPPPGRTLEGAVVLAGERGPGSGAPGEDEVPPTVRVRVLADGQEVATAQLPLPEPGTRARVPFQLAPRSADADAAPVMVRAEVELDGDQYPLDDVLERPAPLGTRGGLLLVSAVPDAEPRVLLPLLEQATGLPGEGWVRVAEDRYLALGGSADPVRASGAAELARAVAEARLLVFQGALGEDTGQGALATAARDHPRRLLLSGAGEAPLAWRVDPDLPVSPLSGFLVEAFPSGGPARLAPILATPGTTPATPVGSTSSTVALRYRAGGAPGGIPAVVLSEGPGWRQVEVRGTGFWRWAAGDPAAAVFHRALWAGAAAWLLAGADTPDPARAGPTIVPSTGALPATALLAPPGEPEAFTPSPPDAGTRVEAAELGARRFRSHPLPWILVALLLSAEWVVRRRLGLR